MSFIFKHNTYHDYCFYSKSYIAYNVVHLIHLYNFKDSLINININMLKNKTANLSIHLRNLTGFYMKLHWFYVRLYIRFHIEYNHKICSNRSTVLTYSLYGSDNWNWRNQYSWNFLSLCPTLTSLHFCVVLQCSLSKDQTGKYSSRNARPAQHAEATQDRAFAISTATSLEEARKWSRPFAPRAGGYVKASPKSSYYQARRINR